MLVAAAATRNRLPPAGGAGGDLEPPPERPAPGAAPGRRGRADPRERRHAPPEAPAGRVRRARPGRRGPAAPRPPRRTATTLDPEEMLPAVGQGTLGVEAREDDAGILALAEALTDAETRTATLAERAFLEAIGGSCTTPLAAYARRTGRSSGSTPSSRRPTDPGRSGTARSASAGRARVAGPTPRRAAPRRGRRGDHPGGAGSRERAGPARAANPGDAAARPGGPARPRSSRPTEPRPSTLPAIAARPARATGDRSTGGPDRSAVPVGGLHQRQRRGGVPGAAGARGPGRAEPGRSPGGRDRPARPPRRSAAAASSPT